MHSYFCFTKFIGKVQQCPTDNLTVSTQVHLCNSLNHETKVSFSCSAVGGSLTWNSLVFATERIVVNYRSDVLNTNLTISGINMIEKHTDDPLCINSTIIFFGPTLHALNGLSVNCSRDRYSHQISSKCMHTTYIIANP